MNNALFAYTVEGKWICISPWASQPEADALWDAAKDLTREGFATVSVWDPKRLEYRQVEVKHFALRPRMHDWVNKEVSNHTRLPVWSKRVYVDEVAAAKAWNRATGKRYHGTEGGWIYRTADNGRLCQGWALLLGAKRRLRAPEGGYRYLVKSVSLRDVLAKVGA